MYDKRLINFNQIMHRVPWRSRKRLLMNLDACKESDGPWGESLSYKKEQLMYSIYRSVKGEPYMQPRFACFIEIQDVKNRQLKEKIMQGINGYLQASDEKQRAFQRNLLNPWTLSNIVARLKPHREF